MRIVVYESVYVRVYRTTNNKKHASSLWSFLKIKLNGDDMHTMNFIRSERLVCFFSFLFLVRCMNGAIALPLHKVRITAKFAIHTRARHSCLRSTATMILNSIN